MVFTVNTCNLTGENNFDTFFDPTRCYVNFISYERSSKNMGTIAPHIYNKRNHLIWVIHLLSSRVALPLINTCPINGLINLMIYLSTHFLRPWSFGFPLPITVIQSIYPIVVQRNNGRPTSIRESVLQWVIMTRKRKTNRSTNADHLLSKRQHQHWRQSWWHHLPTPIHEKMETKARIRWSRNYLFIND